MVEPASILLVDDEPEMGIIVKALGQRHGWRVTHAADARAASAWLRANVPDLVLLDICLPGVNGPEWCRQVRVEPHLAELRVALFTQGSVPAHVVEGLDAGAQYLVVKDLVCRPDEWRTRLGEILAAPRGRGLLPPVGWSAVSAVPLDRAGAVPESLRDASLRAVDVEVLCAVARRALRQANVGAALAGEVERWLVSGRLAQRISVPPGIDPPMLALLLACLAEQLWCLLGGAASAPIRAALRQFVPGLAEGPTWQ